MKLVASNDISIYSRTRLEELEARLHHGDAMIRQREAKSQPVDHLVQHWLDLLREYEVAFRTCQSAA